MSRRVLRTSIGLISAYPGACAATWLLVAGLMITAKLTWAVADWPNDPTQYPAGYQINQKSSRLAVATAQTLLRPKHVRAYRPV